MASPLHVIKDSNETENIEKRVLPRFPYSYLSFKWTVDGESKGIFSINDINHTGMQIESKNEDFNLSQGEEVKGQIHGPTINSEIKGVVRWQEGNKFGIEFSQEQTQVESLKEYLSLENFAKALRPIQKINGGADLPANLNTYLRADGPVEIFIWQYNDGFTSKIQIIMLNEFVEWVDGSGLITGKVISKRNQDLPLNPENEYLFSLDQSVDRAKLDKAKTLVQSVDSSLLEEKNLEFLRLKLGQ